MTDTTDRNPQKVNLIKEAAKLSEAKTFLLQEFSADASEEPAPVSEKTEQSPLPPEKTDPPPAAESVPAPLPDETVTRHTISLWKYLPVPAAEPEPFPEYVTSETEIPGGKLLAARVRGKKHKHEGTNCDDWYEAAVSGKATIIAVSDGAGSKKFSRVGARAACKVAAGYLARGMEDIFRRNPELSGTLGLPLTDPQCQAACGLLAETVQQAVLKAYAAVETAFYVRAAEPAYTAVLGRRLELTDLSGTLLLAAALPVNGERLVVSCQVGDGLIALLNTKGSFSSALKLMGEADSGEFSGETDFLTSEKMHDINTLKSRTKIFCGTVDTVLVMSDGVADDYFPFQPGIQRLYIDLAANGILEDGGPVSLTPRQARLFKRLPDPLEYPWVNDPSVPVALHYAQRLCDAAGLTLQDLWDDRIILRCLEPEGRMKAASPKERLKIWLDNYVVRGSFDDRTLVIAQI
ncbi:MAG: protein phosphatase 2C domain-containing protein [Oscillospiraceae bacterium]|nr:protein phosphatase 2C domain-containing protein [Oscillospiraceae bacterium]